MLLTKLSDLAGISIKHEANDVVNVTLAGGPLVTGVRAEGLTVDASSPSGVVIRWTKDNTVAAITGGTAGGQLSVINDIVPRYLSGIDGVADEPARHGERNPREHRRVDPGGCTGPVVDPRPLVRADAERQRPVTVSVAGANWTDNPAALQTALQNAIDTAIGGAPGQVVATVTQPGGAGTPLSVLDRGCRGAPTP